MDRKVELYGVLRELSAEAAVILTIPDDARPAEVRRALVAWRSEQGVAAAAALHALTQMLERTVVAADDTILSDEEVVGTARTLALLPPVCGG